MHHSCHQMQMLSRFAKIWESSTVCSSWAHPPVNGDFSMQDFIELLKFLMLPNTELRVSQAALTGQPGWRKDDLVPNWRLLFWAPPEYWLFLLEVSPTTALCSRGSATFSHLSDILRVWRTVDLSLWAGLLCRGLLPGCWGAAGVIQGH